jgi:hypothetical protein
MQNLYGMVELQEMDYLTKFNILIKPIQILNELIVTR